MSTKLYLRTALGLLSASSRRRLWLIIGLLGVISVLDLAALIVVLGVLALATKAYSRPDTSTLAELPAPLPGLLQDLGIGSVGVLLSALGGVVILLFVAKSVLACAVLRRTFRFLAAQEANLTHVVMSKLIRAPLTVHLRLGNVDVMTDVTRGIGALVTSGIAPVVLIAVELLLILMVGVGLLFLAPAVAVGAILYFGITFALLNRWIAKRASTAGHSDALSTRRALTIIHWALGGYREVYVRGVAEYFVRELAEVTRSGASSRAEVNYLGVLPRYFLESALVLGLGFTFLVQVPFVGFGGALSGLALFAVAGFRLLPGLNRLQAASASINSAKPFGERALALLQGLESVGADTPLRNVTVSGTKTLSSGLTLDEVSFNYPGATQPALSRVSLHIPAGRMTALVGASGSGKSTLVDLMLGLLPPDEGRVLVDGRPMGSLDEDWLSHVGYVPQDVFLMPTSVKANVALGLADADIDDAKVWKALQRAALDDVVAALPGQLQFRLGDAGAGISGGQRQRLGIARALYVEPTLLFLDEATSALDVETEAEVTETLSGLDGLTKVVVAHRLSTVLNADQVIFLAAGRVRAVGSFTEVCRLVPDFARQVELSGLKTNPT